MYLERTKDIRGSINNLFISFKRPHKVVGTQTISRWIKKVMYKSGIDINIFSAYSTHHTSTSAAKRHGVNIDQIRKTAGWSKDSETFARFYNRRIIVEDKNFAEAVLGTDVTIKKKKRNMKITLLLRSQIKEQFFLFHMVRH